MKKIIFSFFAFTLYTAASAQDTSMKAAATAVCDCLTKATDDKMTQEKIQQAFLNCIFTSAPDLVTKIATSGGDYEKAGQELGTSLAMEMLKSGCPAFTKLAGSMAMSGDNEETMNAPAKDEATETADGIVTKVEEKDFIYITIKTTTGRELNFIYYNYVPGSDEWIKDPVNKLKNKNVYVSYSITEVYQPKLKEFMNLKEIKTLTIK